MEDKKTKGKSKEDRYQDLLNAMSEGEFGMTKFLWDLLERIEGVADVPGKKIETFQKTIDQFIKDYKTKDGKPGEPGKPPSKELLISLIKPLIPPAKEGKMPSKRKLLELIESVMPDPIPGERGLPGKPGKRGLNGRMPKHEWNGTFIRFENPDGSWGEWKNIQGPGGGSMNGPSEGGFGGGLMRVRGTDFEMQGVSQIYLGNNLVATRLGDGSVRIDAQGGASGVNIITEELSGTQSGNDVTIDLTDLSEVYDTVQFVTRQGQILAASDWSKTGDIITIFNADAATEKYSVQVTY